MNVKRLTTMAMLSSMSLSFFLLESLIPIPPLPPGAKLGLANLVTVVALYRLGSVDAAIVLTSRILLSTLFSPSPFVILFSIVGAAFSFASMLALKRSNLFSIVGVAAAGGFAHNLGQIIVAVFVLDSLAVVNYLPILGTCGVVTGTILGSLAARIVNNF